MMFQSLRTRYDEATMATLLGQARNSITAGSAVASKLETAQRKLWTDSGKTVDDVFRLLKLEDEADEVFKSPLLHLWAVYAARRDGDRAGELMFQSLMAHQDDIGLTKMLLEAKKSPDKLIKATATKIETAQLANWARKEKTVGDVYRLLKLDEEGAKLFENPVVDVWISYAAKLDESRAGEMLFRSLKTHFDEASLAELLATTALRPYKTLEMVGNVRDAQLSHWMAKGRSVDDIFRLLKLDEEGSKLFENQMIFVWASYATKVGNERGGELLLASLKALQKSDASLGRMIGRAKRLGRTEAVATRFEAAQLTNWLDRGESLGGVFRLLKLDEEGDKLFKNPAVDLWAGIE